MTWPKTRRATSVVALGFLTSVLLVSFSSRLFAKELISTSAGRVGDTVITTREVMLNHLIEGALYPKEGHTQLDPNQIKSREFIHETTSDLLETAIAKEAAAFGVVPVSNERLNSSEKRVRRLLRRNAQWRELKPSSEEIKNIVETKLRAKDFIKFKVDSATVPITDQEALDYFNANRLKFENLPFSKFKDTIKAYLTKQRVDSRLKNWFDFLQSKYRIRNLLAQP